MSEVKISEDWGFNQVKTTGWLDTASGSVVLATEQDLTEIANRNKADRKASAVSRNSGSGRFGDFAKVATIPNIKVDELMKKGIWQDRKLFKKWLNDPDNKCWRTIECRL